MECLSTLKNIIHLTNALDGSVLVFDYYGMSGMSECKDCGHTIIKTGENKQYFVKESILEVCFAAGDIYLARNILEEEVYGD